MTIQITRTEFPAAELRHRAHVASDPDQARELLRPSLRSWMAPAAPMRRRARGWNGRRSGTGFTASTPKAWTGLKTASVLDASRCLRRSSVQSWDELVETPPDPVKDGVVRWRCSDLKARIKTLFGVEISPRSVGRVLRQRKFRRLAPRPQHPKADEAQQLISAKASPLYYGSACLSTPKESPSKFGSRTRRA